MGCAANYGRRKRTILTGAEPQPKNYWWITNNKQLIDYKIQAITSISQLKMISKASSQLLKEMNTKYHMKLCYFQELTLKMIELKWFIELQVNF